LVSSGLTRYLEFKVVENTYLFLENEPRLVPCSKSDLFKSKFISLVEKRILSKFLAFVKDYFEKETKEEIEGTFLDLLNSHNLTPNLQAFVLYAIAFVDSNQQQDVNKISKTEGLQYLQKYMASLGRYGNTPFIVSLYGISELPQAFCRLCAVYGGLYMLRVHPAHFAIENGVYKGITATQGQPFTSKHLVANVEYMPAYLDISKQCTISRCVCITNASLREGENQIIAVIPPGVVGNQYAIRVLQFSWEMFVCPQGTYVLYFSTICSKTAQEDLESALNSLVNLSENSSKRPTALYHAYFNQFVRVPIEQSKTLPENVFLCSNPGVDLDCAQSFEEAQKIFSQICPGEEFLPKTPDPDDIIWEDNSATQNEAMHMQS